MGEKSIALHPQLVTAAVGLVLWAGSACAASRAYITRPYAGTVVVIDTETDTVIATIDVPNAPTAVAVHPQGRELYVTTPVNNTVSVIDTFENRVIGTIPVPYTHRIVVSPSGDRLYATHYTSGTVSVIDTATRSLVATVPAGEAVTDIAVSADGNQLYVVNKVKTEQRPPCSPPGGAGPFYCDIPVAIVDTTSYALTLVPIGDYLTAVAADPRGGRFYVSNIHWQGPENIDFTTVLSIIDTTSAGEDRISDIQLNDSNPGTIAVQPDGTRIYVSASPGVWVLDGMDTLVGTISVDATRGMSVTPDGKKLYALGNNDVLSVVDTTTDALIATIPIGRLSYALGQFIGPDIDFPTPTPPPLGPCIGDCDGDGAVRTAELVSCVDIALGTMPIVRCPACAADAGDSVMINDVVRAVDAAVRGCVAE